MLNEICNHNDENEYPIARCEECGAFIYNGSADIYLDSDSEYFCCLECALNYHGIHLADDCLVMED